MSTIVDRARKYLDSFGGWAHDPSCGDPLTVALAEAVIRMDKELNAVDTKWTIYGWEWRTWRVRWSESRQKWQLIGRHSKVWYGDYEKPMDAMAEAERLEAL